MAPKARGRGHERGARDAHGGRVGGRGKRGMIADVSTWREDGLGRETARLGLRARGYKKAWPR